MNCLLVDNGGAQRGLDPAHPGPRLRPEPAARTLLLNAWTPDLTAGSRRQPRCGQIEPTPPRRVWTLLRQDRAAASGTGWRTGEPGHRIPPPYRSIRRHQQHTRAL